MSWMKANRIEQLVDKLQRIVLSSSPLNEIDPDLRRMFEAAQKATRSGAQEDADRVEQVLDDAPPPTQVPPTMLWEPLSDANGELLRHYGWAINTTIYLLNGQTWWLVRAEHNRDRTGPTDGERKQLDKVLRLLGSADPDRDLLNAADLPEGKWARMYTWFHRGPLYETHENKKTGAMRIVEEGTPLPAGFERVPRLDINNLPK